MAAGEEAGQPRRRARRKDPALPAELVSTLKPYAVQMALSVDASGVRSHMLNVSTWADDGSPFPALFAHLTSTGRRYLGGIADEPDFRSFLIGQSMGTLVGLPIDEAGVVTREHAQQLVSNAMRLTDHDLFVAFCRGDRILVQIDHLATGSSDGRGNDVALREICVFDALVTAFSAHERTMGSLDRLRWERLSKLYRGYHQLGCTVDNYCNKPKVRALSFAPGSLDNVMKLLYETLPGLFDAQGAIRKGVYAIKHAEADQQKIEEDPVCWPLVRNFFAGLPCSIVWRNSPFSSLDPGK